MSVIWSINAVQNATWVTGAWLTCIIMLVVMADFFSGWYTIDITGIYPF